MRILENAAQMNASTPPTALIGHVRALQNIRNEYSLVFTAVRYLVVIFDAQYVHIHRSDCQGCRQIISCERE